MKKIWNSIARDLWIVLLDIVAVNASYLLALLIRFFVNGEFREIVNTTYLPAFWTFAPFYTILAIAVFAVLRLYGGMWRYAGMNDMNRILCACGITTVIQVVGTCLFVARMPITYYVIGALLQFIFVAMIRFANRIIQVEKKKVANRKTPVVPSMVIGAGETARKAIVHLEETPFRAVVAVDEKSAGKWLNGVPVVADYGESLSSVRAVFIADGTLSAEKRKEINDKCAALNIEVQDYTGYLSNLGGKIPVSSLLEMMNGPVRISVDGDEHEYVDGAEALKALRDHYEVESIEGAKISLKKASSVPYAGYDAWAQKHKENTGEDVSFF